MNTLKIASTGLTSLDAVIHNLRLGDNVVWQVDCLEDYLHFVKPYIKQALKEKRNLVYIRFASHRALVSGSERIKTYQIDASAGFESFTKQIHEIITKEGIGAYYLFDCLSDLLNDWATDLTIGNFFMVTCPYLFRLDTIAYFAILRDSHSFKTIARIRETTQLLLDVFSQNKNYYVHPLKVWDRYSPTMFLPHIETRGVFQPLTNSVDLSKYISRHSAESSHRQLDYWDRLFIEADELARSPGAPRPKKLMLKRLSAVMLGREKRMLSLIKDHFSLEDLLEIKKRMIGTGYVGGKSLGMLLARKILIGDKTFDWQAVLEPHDSFFIGSDVFYTYIVENGWWQAWLEQKTEKGYFSQAGELREKFLTGVFPLEIREQFQQMIEYFGGAPIIVRSSSLLEDAFGNAFAGKYESIFVVNQGTPEERCKKFEEAVRQVFASTMHEDALNYRLQRGLSQQDEQMALLIQRVSGKQRKQTFFPFLAGVGLSRNTFVWDKDMDPKAGMLRLVFGLGTRAVNRVEGDYPRIVALDAPLKRPYAGMEKTKKFSQHDVDLLDIKNNVMGTKTLGELLKMEPEIDLSMIGQRDTEAEDKLRQMGVKEPSWLLTFDKLLSDGDFTAIMRRMLQTLERSYNYPVDVEFTVNYDAQGKLCVNLVQCRPLQVKGSVGQVHIPQVIPPGDLIFSSEGNFMGGSVCLPLKNIIYIDPAAYSDLLMSKKFEIARIIGRLNKMLDKKETLLIGPGRWGSRDATLGVPVTFAEINNVSALVEIDDPSGGFMPELSFGSHFFLDLVEADIFYAALFMQNQGTVFNKGWLDKLANQLEKYLPDAKDYNAVVKITNIEAPGLKLLSDITSQRVVGVLHH